MTKKHILILTLHKPEEFQFEEWIKNSNEACMLSLVLDRESVTDKKLSQLKKNSFFNFVCAYDNYLNNGKVYHDLMLLNLKYPVTHIIAMGEDDIIRAARLREWWNLPGQSIENAIRFRDKSVMRSSVLSVGIQTHEGIAIENPLSLIQFIEKNGFPVYVKPRSSSGSVGGKKISSSSELAQVLATSFKPRIPYSEYASDLCVETFQTGDLYHVDGIIINGIVAFIYPFKYLTKDLQINQFSNDDIVGSIMLSEFDKHFHPLVEYVTRTCMQLELSHGHTFHAEVFINEYDELSLCEIAARTGGGRINEVIVASGGPDLNRLQFLVQSGLYSAKKAKAYLKFKYLTKVCGWFLIPPQPGICKSIPDFISPNIVSSKLILSVGEQGWLRSFSGDSIGHVIVTGKNHQDTLKNLQAIIKTTQESLCFSDSIPSPCRVT